MKLVNVIITAYNAEQTIEETLLSVVEQSYRDLRVVIIDDFSTDSTCEIVERLMVNDARIILKKNPRKGRAQALNFALSELHQNAVVAICDADDLWHKDKLRFQVQLLTNNSNSLICSESLVGSGQPLWESYESFDFSALSKTQMLVRNPICHSSIIGERRFFRYDETRSGQYDYQLFLSLFREGVGILCVSGKLVFHRISENQNFEASGMRYRLNGALLGLYYSALFRNALGLMVNVVRIVLFSLNITRRNVWDKRNSKLSK